MNNFRVNERYQTQPSIIHMIHIPTQNGQKSGIQTMDNPNSSVSSTNMVTNYPAEAQCPLRTQTARDWRPVGPVDTIDISHTEMAHKRIHG
jgi:hypothetical protein